MTTINRQNLQAIAGLLVAVETRLEDALTASERAELKTARAKLFKQWLKTVNEVNKNEI